MARPKNDPVEAVLDRFFELTLEQQAQFERTKQSIEARLQKILDYWPRNPHPLSVNEPIGGILDSNNLALSETKPPKKRRGRPPKVQAPVPPEAA